MVVQSSSPPVEDDIPFNGPTPAVVPQVVPVPIPAAAGLPTIPPLAPAQVTIPPLLPQPGNVWLVATDLVVGDNGRVLQSAQSAEVNRCISKAIRLATSNIFFVNVFPSLQEQTQWLTQSLVTILQDQAQTDLVVYKVNLHAQQDNRYMSALISMVRHWFPSLLLPTLFLNPTRRRADGATPVGV